MVSIKLDRKLFVFLIVCLLIISAILIAWYGLQPKHLKMEYNNVGFVKKDGLWFAALRTEQGPVLLSFHHNPQEVEKVPVSGTVPDDFFKDTIYLTAEPGDPPNFPYDIFAIQELMFTARDAWKTKFIISCTFNGSACPEDAPIVTCASQDKRVIYFDRTGLSGVTVHGNCITVKGSNRESMRSSDKLLYVSLGIIK